MKYYTGIGSRETPKWACDIMVLMGEKLGQLGWHLRSGGAPGKNGVLGADRAFQEGANLSKTPFSIYLPNSSFYGLTPKDRGCVVPSLKFPNQWNEALKMGSQFHPNWPALQAKGINGVDLMTRNVFQVLGDDLQTPSKFVTCWAKKSIWKDEKIVSVDGGTGQAVRIASHFKIPIYNLNEKEHLLKICKWLNITPSAEAFIQQSKIKGVS